MGGRRTTAASNGLAVRAAATATSTSSSSSNSNNSVGSGSSRNRESAAAREKASFRATSSSVRGSEGERDNQQLERAFDKLSLGSAGGSDSTSRSNNNNSEHNNNNNNSDSEDDLVETPTGSSSALVSSPPPATAPPMAPSVKLSDVNRSVTHPIRLLHENLMLELFQEQLRMPSPVRQSGPGTSAPAAATRAHRSSQSSALVATRASADASGPRASVTLLPTPRPTVVLYESPSGVGTSTMSVSGLDGSDAAPPRECQICFDKMDALQAHVCVACGGAFCSTCMQWYVEFKVLDGEVSRKRLVCPAPQCARALGEELVEAFASPETFAKYRAFVRDQRAGVRFCPRAGCCAPLDEPPFSRARRAKCGACAEESCMRCGGAYHRARVCRRTDKRFGRWKRRHNVRACPSCRADIEKQGGCSHMKCLQCDMEFCWSCLRAWDRHDETLCVPLAFFHSRSRKFGWCAPVRAVTKTVVLGAAGAVAVAGVGVAAVVLPPLLGYYLVRDHVARRRLARRESADAPAAVPTRAAAHMRS